MNAFARVTALGASVLLAAAPLSAPMPAAALDPEFASFCQRYADEAVTQVGRATGMNCGFSGPRWDTNRANHFNWCITNDGAYQPPAIEGLARVKGIKDCAARNAAWTPKPVETQRAAVVTGDVDVYDQPGGGGRVTGMLRSGTAVTISLPCNVQDWCRILGEAVPGGQGYVWGHLRF